jgi:heptosyltransferase-2
MPPNANASSAVKQGIEASNHALRRYLIVGPSWIGDMVMAQSLFITLKQQYPDCLIDVLAPAWSLPILKRMPEVAEGISADVGHGEFSFFKRRKLGLSLKQKKYTHAIVIPRSWKSALIPFFADVPTRTGYRGEMRYGLLNDIRVLDKNVLKQTVQRYVAHAYENAPTDPPEIPYPALLVDNDNQQKLLARLGLMSNRPIICMMPGAEYGPAKQWPLAYYKQLAERLVGDGWQIWLLGSDKDKAAGEEISGMENIYNLCGETSLVDVIDLLSYVEQVVTNDSGLMHVAAAMRVRVNAIYGSSTPAYTPPLTKNSDVFYTDRECSPCFARTCRYGHYKCLGDISADDIFDAISAYSKRQEARC